MKYYMQIYNMHHPWMLFHKTASTIMCLQCVLVSFPDLPNRNAYITCRLNTESLIHAGVGFETSIMETLEPINVQGCVAVSICCQLPPS